METLLDDSVGKEVNLQIERGGVPLTVKLEVICNFDASYFIFSAEKNLYILMFTSFHT